MSSRVPYEQARTLLEKYKASYELRYEQRAEFNVVKARYDIADIIRELGYEETDRLFGYFFRTKGGHELKRFIYNYDQLYTMMLMQDADAIRREELLNVELA